MYLWQSIEEGYLSCLAAHLAVQGGWDCPSCVNERSRAFSFPSSAGVGSLDKVLYVSPSARRS